MKQADNAVEAAKRVAGHTGGYGDTLIVAWAYLAEHPADDEIPVNNQWCRTLKTMSHQGDNIGDTYEVGNKAIVINVEDFGVLLVCFGHRVCVGPTRGDVRRLARALRIDLKEGQS